MKRSLILFGLVVLMITCISKKDRELRRVLNSTLHLDGFEIVQQRNNVLLFEDFRDRYKYISVVYLLNGCEPCYSQFIEWQHKMDSMKIRKDYTVLFIIRGESYSDLMANVLDVQFVEDHYYTIMDPNYMFLDDNKHIPKWIIDGSILIDSENKIRMVGKPWINKDMTELFYNICGI